MCWTVDVFIRITKNKTTMKNTKNIRIEILPNTPTSAIALNTFLYIFLDMRCET